MARSVEDSRAAREAKLDALHDRLTGTVEQLVSGEDWARALEFAARFRARSFANTILIFTQHHRPFEMLLDPQINANALTWAQDNNKARTETIDDGKGSSLVRGVELTGFEPVTPTLPVWCATSCAIAPLWKRYEVVEWS